MPIMVFHSEDIMEVKACIERKGYTVIVNVQMNNSQEGTFTCPSGNSFICTFKNSP